MERFSLLGGLLTESLQTLGFALLVGGLASRLAGFELRLGHPKLDDPEIPRGATGLLRLLEREHDVLVARNHLEGLAEAFLGTRRIEPAPRTVLDDGPLQHAAVGHDSELQVRAALDLLRSRLSSHPTGTGAAADLRLDHLDDDDFAGLVVLQQTALQAVA